MTSFRTSIMLGACAAAMLSQPALAREEEGGSGIQVGRLEVSPYIEAAQVLTSRLSPDSDSVTYTRIAAGVDTAMASASKSIDPRLVDDLIADREARIAELEQEIAKLGGATLSQADPADRRVGP